MHAIDFHMNNSSVQSAQASTKNVHDKKQYILYSQNSSYWQLNGILQTDISLEPPFSSYTIKIETSYCPSITPDCHCFSTFLLLLNQPHSYLRVHAQFPHPNDSSHFHKCLLYHSIWPPCPFSSPPLVNNLICSVCLQQSWSNWFKFNRTKKGPDRSKITVITKLVFCTF